MQLLAQRLSLPLISASVDRCESLSRTFRQVRPENPFFVDQILVLEQQFLIHQASNIRQETDPSVIGIASDHHRRT